jgi:hypothetical protein
MTPKFRAVEVGRRHPSEAAPGIIFFAGPLWVMSAVFAMSTMSPVYLRLPKDCGGERTDVEGQLRGIAVASPG